MNLKKALPIFLAFLLMLVSVNAYATQPSKVKYDGETLFRGIIFGQGPVAHLFPEIWTKDLLSKVNQKETKQVIDHLVARMKAKSPSYFAEFERAVYSGDHLKINKAIDKGGQILDQVIKEDERRVKSGKEGYGTGQCVLYVAYAAAAISAAAIYSHIVALNAGGAVTIYLAVAVSKYFWVGDKPNELALQKEMLINNIVERLATQ
ncbi:MULTISPECIES: sporulation delaying protein family toxin [Bacillales]|jgi:SdpC family antimicrobial peptide|uniref:sporulation delaying protein family toxin n=1 Tax=Brevibacillus TaxID=55080 RepID=UPI001492A5E6|nr:MULTISPECIES: sporulation delaying protein family toxin [Bacillales]NNV02198.1 sporulation delaying protein family toxin [Brevibacillus sp. MCWH]UFJ62878.1 sporulation delaying protein family toxin [Anoxybacillus sediminis]